MSSRAMIVAAVGAGLVAGCGSGRTLEGLAGPEAVRPALVRLGDGGPPPPGHEKIVGGVVPGWKPEHMLGRGLGPAAPITWAPLGPRPITGEYWSGNDDASGRIVSIAPHPVDPDTVYVASASGGIWKTTDGGVNWTPLTDELSNMNHGAVALDPSNPDTIYAGTGEYTLASIGDGIFRSTDAGATWERVATREQAGARTSALAVDPTDPLVIHYAGTGYAHTLDGGTTWQRRLSGNCSALALHPLDPSVVYVARQTRGVYRSVDRGVTFEQLTSGLPANGFGRVVLAQARSNPDVLYAAFASGGDVIGTYRTDDGGDTWVELVNTPNFARPQAWYDMYVAVDPTDEDTVYCGGVSPIYAEAGIIKSTDGGQTWTEISAGAFGGQTHPDHHWLAFGPDGTLWEGNDGGVWKSPDGGLTWIDCNATLTVTQHYTVGLSPHATVRVLGGTQDNGSIERIADGLAWPQVIGGDGGFLAYDHEAAHIKYTTYVYLAVQRWIGGAFRNISGPWQGDNRNFIAPLVMDPNDSSTLLGGTNRVWRTLNADGAATWTPISTSAVGGGGTLNALAVAPGDSNIIYTGSSTGRVFVTTDATTWADRSAGLPSGPISDLLLDPEDPGRAYVSSHNHLGPRVLRTLDFGATWTDLTGDLPFGVRARALAVDWRLEPPDLYIGSGAGVWSSHDDGATWLKDGLDLPNVNVGDLQLDLDRAVIIAGTFGRGAWQATLPPVVACAGDVDGNGFVDIADLLAVLTAWGPCKACPADFNDDGVVDFADLLVVLTNWGAC